MEKKAPDSFREKPFAPDNDTQAPRPESRAPQGAEVSPDLDPVRLDDEVEAYPTRH